MLIFFSELQKLPKKLKILRFSLFSNNLIKLRNFFFFEFEFFTMIFDAKKNPRPH